MTFNNAGQPSSRQPLNPALSELLSRAEIAHGACSRWVRRLDNAIAKLPSPDSGHDEIGILEQKAQAVLHGPRRTAGLSRLDVEIWLESGAQKLSVELDPARPAHEQAQDWIALARKKRRTLAGVAARRSAIDDEWLEASAWKERLETWLSETEAAPKGEVRKRQTELDKLQARLLPRGLWPQPPRKREQEKPSGPVRWDLPGGWILLAGRSGTENDLLTQRVALAHDLWFHAAHVPGSHVILRSPNGKPAIAPPEFVETAAGVAAWLSKLRAQGIAEVHVTEKRHVRKPRKAPPGTVVLDHSRTLRVKPVPPPRDTAI
jgi:predicted ribosome quality control (RQC) complex YloA/Tae2 family protein